MEKWQRKFVAVDEDKAIQDLAIAAGPKEATDVVIVRSGGAGLSAAIAARDSSVKVILLEKDIVEIVCNATSECP